MHCLHRFIKYNTPSLSLVSKKLHTEKLKNISKNSVFALVGFGMLSWYYLFVIPKWINQSKTSSLQYETEELIDNGNSKIHLESKLCNGAIDGARKQFNFIDKVVENCAPGVFHILISTTKPSSNTEISPFVYGSGFIIRKDGWAITNAHVVLNKDSYISCKMSDGKVYSAEIIDIDVNVDVALLKLNTDEELTALELEKPGEVNVGEWVVALGSPLSLSNSISVGVVSSTNRTARELGLKNYSMSYIQTDALITFGNSGGPLVNLDGKVIGISSLRLTSGISFAIPIEYCLRFLQKCRALNPQLKINTTRDNDEDLTLFGLTTISMTSDLMMDTIQKKLLEIPKNVNEGLLVWKVLEGSIAKECGLAPGDIITHVDNVPIKYISDIYSSNKEIVRFIVIKNGTEKEVTISVPMSKNVSQEWL